ncbi:hypothetical protein FNF27_04133 [Cafeteria roenbergensis]|uniref:Choline/carnitine acyltransferase domain-containing protein n=1 Tax=Cafeteria roenbergensis TaxID=33653 RepID=A0A5A8EET1_CAFRO|nr:hypothetical protein FNF27_04133 [Cafeteria roenbergensis]
MAAAASATSADVPAVAPGTLYAHQRDLATLPVPSLEQTLEKLLRSVKPHVTDEEYQHTEAVCREFEAGAGKGLQELLEERGASMPNWLEEWWEQFAYLRPRYPAAVNINWFGLLPGTWGARQMTQAGAAAALTRHIVGFRQNVLRGTVEPETMAGRKLCMNQWTRMFNTCKVPVDEGYDEFATYEDLQLDSVAVVCDGAVFCFPVTVAGLERAAAEAAGRPVPADTTPRLSEEDVEVRGPAGHLPEDHPCLASLSFADLELQFTRVIEASSVLFELQRRGEHVSVLTSEERGRWAQAFDHLVSLDPCNKASFDAVQRAIFVMVLEKESKPDLEARAQSALLGTGIDCRNRWFDKPFNMIVYPDGKGAVNGEHAWADAMVMASVFGHILDGIDREFRAHGGPIRGASTPPEALPPPRQLKWKLDTPAVQALELASANGYQLARSIDLRLLLWPHFGKGLMKRHRLVPDFFVQMAIQLAYRRLHGRCVATYETAHTRLFYHGRTETIRVCSTESVAFCEAMLDEDATDGARFEALKAAIQAHLAFTRDCLMGQGIDRHMMGLYILANMQGLDPMPSVFTDRGIKTAGRYTLSTSNISMKGSPLFGGFSPMYEDGYGVCYGIQEESLKFSIAANKSCKDTSASDLRESLARSLLDMQRVLLSRNTIYLGAPASADAASAPKGESGGATADTERTSKL